MKVQYVCNILEEFAPLALQEAYDNAGLIVGEPFMEVTGILITLDVTMEVLEEAHRKECNFILAHHPLIFNPLKRLIGQNETERCVVFALKNDLAVYAAHTNLDNLWNGVNHKIAEKLQLVNTQVLKPLSHQLLKLITFVPHAYADNVRKALFDAGAGNIGNYDSCSFNVEGKGTFKADENAHPFVGEHNEFHIEPETRIEVILPYYLKSSVLNALLQAHPYEEPAYDLILLENDWHRTGAGLMGNLETPIDELTFLRNLKTVFSVPCIRHTPLLGKDIVKVAVCGGSGSTFLRNAIQQGADVFISADFKYHEFFNADGKILIADVGHYESEQFTKDIFYEIISKKIPNFVVKISETYTNPINYL
ncbi:MAG: Nif3-like dinuclear metal center hexameric protein [Paludibacteraceae bacterium]|jgi:dinuclear metal center YbgI/SA1388 family protein|nr:Nif3-like dinuclear metal center hexameric protein [Paludibacteraceae bacterium]